MVSTQIKIRYITPFASDKNIGREYNQVIAELPEDCYVVLRDGDTMFLTSDWGKQIEDIIQANPSFDLITCMTNRLGVKDQIQPGMFDENRIERHLFTSEMIANESRTVVEESKLAAGLCMIFKKSLWAELGGFTEKSILFDRVFSDKVIKAGGKIGIAKGLYLLHLYRWGKPMPQLYKKHLL